MFWRVGGPLWIGFTVFWWLYSGPRVPVCRQQPFHPQFRNFIQLQLKKIPSLTQSLLQVRSVISHLLRYSVAYSLDSREGSLGTFLIFLSGLGESMKVHASLSALPTCTEHIGPCYHTRCLQFSLCSQSCPAAHGFSLLIVLGFWVQHLCFGVFLNVLICHRYVLNPGTVCRHKM